MSSHPTHNGGTNLPDGASSLSASSKRKRSIGDDGAQSQEQPDTKQIRFDHDPLAGLEGLANGNNEVEEGEDDLFSSSLFASTELELGLDGHLPAAAGASEPKAGDAPAPGASATTQNGARTAEAAGSESVTQARAELKSWLDRARQLQDAVLDPQTGILAQEQQELEHQETRARAGEIAGPAQTGGPSRYAVDWSAQDLIAFADWAAPAGSRSGAGGESTGSSKSRGKRRAGEEESKGMPCVSLFPYLPSSSPETGKTEGEGAGKDAKASRHSRHPARAHRLFPPALLPHVPGVMQVGQQGQGPSGSSGPGIQPASSMQQRPIGASSSQQSSMNAAASQQSHLFSSQSSERNGIQSTLHSSTTVPGSAPAGPISAASAARLAAQADPLTRSLGEASLVSFSPDGSTLLAYFPAREHSSSSQAAAGADAEAGVGRLCIWAQATRCRALNDWILVQQVVTNVSLPSSPSNALTSDANPATGASGSTNPLIAAALATALQQYQAQAQVLGALDVMGDEPISIKWLGTGRKVRPLHSHLEFPTPSHWHSDQLRGTH